MPTSVPPSAERRALTVMFCDLVGSTAMAARLDPEDLRDLLASYQRQASAVVEAAGGRVARYEGDGILAYFGYPAAAEDDAERAVRAGLELARGIPAEGAARLSVRVGIATGLVVVGELHRSRVADNPPVVGETPNLAARLQALAEPGTVAIDQGTRHLTGGLFEYGDGGLRRLEGFSQPVQVWRVIGGRTTSRFKALRSQSLPLVGREPTMRALADLWAATEKGSGWVALITGEAGIGKSRLALELARHVHRRPATALRFQCHPRHDGSLLHPILERLRRAAHPRRAAGQPSAGTARLQRLLRRRVDMADGAIALLAELMALPIAAGLGPRPDAQRRRDQLLEALATSLDRLAQERPVLLVVEDAHWIDPTSLQLLDLVVGRMTGRAMLLAVTARPEFQPAWLGRPHVAQIQVGPVGTAAAEALARGMPGAASLPDAVIRGIAVRADGVPLYIEELTKAVLDGAALAHPGQAEGQGAAIPSSLNASLMARLDRLGPPREVARIAAVLGREFTFALLRAVLPDRDPDSLRHDIERLVDADLLVPVASVAVSEAYAFRHALIQDAAYGALLRSERRALHGRIAAAIAASFPEVAATQPEIVAGHCTRAELWEPAAVHWLAAGKRAVRGWALAEAERHLSQGIRAAANLPPSPTRDRLELDLHMALGPVLMGTRGYAAKESLEVYRRAEPLVHALGDVPERLMAMLGLFNVHYGRAELSQALGVAEAYFALARQHGVSLGRGHGLIAQTRAAMGDFEGAARAFQASLDVFARAPEDVSALGVFCSQHVISLALVSGVHFALGRPEESRATIAGAITLARQCQHALSIALALVTELLTPIPGGLDPDLARAEEAVRFCARHRLGNFRTWAEFARGAIVARRGDPRAGLGQMRAAIDAAEAMSSRLFRPTQLGTLASAHARLGEMDEALALLDRALAIAGETGEHRAVAALHRLRGELLLVVGRKADAHAALQQSLAVARAQHVPPEIARTESAIARLAGQRGPER